MMDHALDILRSGTKGHAAHSARVGGSSQDRLKLLKAKIRGRKKFEFASFSFDFASFGL
jgi:hypothetical protein